MRTAVVRVNLDPEGRHSAAELSRVVEKLRSTGAEVRSPDLETLPATAREIELLVSGDDPAQVRTWAETACSRALGSAGPQAGQPTFLSRGTDDDALGVVRAFGVTAGIERLYDHGEEIVVITLSRSDSGRVVESRLHTALEAALNCEVRIVVL
jgi:hypothetical protein